jgi:hypothetical protein
MDTWLFTDLLPQLQLLIELAGILFILTLAVELVYQSSIKRLAKK